MYILGTGKTIRRFGVRLIPIDYNIDTLSQMPQLREREYILAKVAMTTGSMFFVCTSLEDIHSILGQSSTYFDVISIQFFTSVLEFALIFYNDVVFTEEKLQDLLNTHHSAAVDAVREYSFHNPNLVAHFADLLERCKTREAAEDLVGIPLGQYTIHDAQRILMDNPVKQE